MRMPALLTACLAALAVGTTADTQPSPPALRRLQDGGNPDACSSDINADGTVNVVGARRVLFSQRPAQCNSPR